MRDQDVRREDLDLLLEHIQRTIQRAVEDAVQKTKYTIQQDLQQLGRKINWLMRRTRKIRRQLDPPEQSAPGTTEAHQPEPTQDIPAEAWQEVE